MGRITDMSAADEAKVVDIVCSYLDAVREMITSEASWQRLQDFFYEAMLGRHTVDAAKVIAWADAGHPAADRAVRRYIAEMVDQGREVIAHVSGRQMVDCLHWGTAASGAAN
jgi:hypothetical protein